MPSRAVSSTSSSALSAPCLRASCWPRCSGRATSLVGTSACRPCWSRCWAPSSCSPSSTCSGVARCAKRIPQSIVISRGGGCGRRSGPRSTFLGGPAGAPADLHFLQPRRPGGLERRLHPFRGGETLLGEDVADPLRRHFVSDLGIVEEVLAGHLGLGVVLLEAVAQIDHAVAAAPQLVQQRLVG